MKKKANSIESLKEEGLVTTADKIVDQNGDTWTFHQELLKLGTFSTMDGILPIVDTIGYSVDMDKVSNEDFEKLQALPRKWVKFQNWQKQIEDYCSTVGILPEDLILAHKSLNKPFKSKKGKIPYPQKKTPIHLLKSLLNSILTGMRTTEKQN